MATPLLFVAVLANTLLLASSGNVQSHAQSSASAYSSSHVSSASSHSKSFAIATSGNHPPNNHPPPPCDKSTAKPCGPTQTPKCHNPPPPPPCDKSTAKPCTKPTQGPKCHKPPPPPPCDKSTAKPCTKPTQGPKSRNVQPYAHSSATAYSSSSSHVSSSSSHSKSVAIVTSGKHPPNKPPPPPPCDKSTAKPCTKPTQGPKCHNPPPPPPCDKSTAKPCTKPTQGPKCCNLHEEWSNCPIAVCRPKSCDDVGNPVACPDLKPDGKCPVPPGCICEEGYVWDKYGVCIRMEHCPKPCGHNEVYNDCIQGQCGPKNCTQLGFSLPCPRIDPKYCQKGCLCEEGYLRNKHGKCIHKDKCPSCGNDFNAKAGCGINCNRHCSDIGKKPGACIEICYENACDCKPGFYYDDFIHKCVLAEDCTPTCGPNEYYSNCTQGDCSPQNCTQLGYPIACPRVDPKYCKKGCLCKEGYARDCDGVCIPVKQCPSCGGDPYAESGCGNNCGRLCSNYKDKDVVCTLECQLNGCDCKDGYVYDTKKGYCVLPCDCTPVCKKNEVYSECINGGCTAKNCSQIGHPIPCVKIDPKYCIKGCLCDDGYLREKNGTCVLAKDCKPPVCKKNEVYSECINGGCTAKNCSQIGHPIPCVKIDPKYCIKGCLCDDGYLREKNGTCVLAKDCKHNCTKQNEVYEPCGYSCPPNTCESINKTYHCPAQIHCQPQCKCRKGFYRNKRGECISEKQCLMCTGPFEYFACGGACDNVCETLDTQNQTNCPMVNIKCNEKCYCEKDYARAKNGTCIPIDKCKEDCGKNERYEQCPAWLTGPQNCSQLGYPIPDPEECDDGKCPVKPACVCIDGYVRDCNGVCIPKKDCPCCGGDCNAHSGCGINCNKKCEDLGKEPGACITLCKDNACDCNDGYYFNNDTKTCVPACECPVCSGDNEVYEDCTNPSCRPMKCSQVGFPLNCTDPPACKKGCDCKEGYARDSKGKCVTLKQCGICGGKKNQVSGCGINCLKKCYDLQNPDHPRPCPKICKVNACDCKKGYYYDEITGECVKAKDCTHSCPTNEVYDPCVNGGCGHRNCSQLNGPILCIDPIKCKGGCTCKKGYLRYDRSGKCVPINQCPESCTKPNEIFVKCPPHCPPQTCESLNRTYHCPLIKIKINESDCVGECRCIKGYYRNWLGECISKKNCLKCNGAHEYFSCGPECDNVCCDLDKQSKDNCPKVNKKCVERCYCEDGYARDKNGTCIPICDCPERSTSTTTTTSTTCITTSTTPKPTVNCTIALEHINEGNIKNSLAFLRDLLSSNSKENFMISALSLMGVLAPITLGSYDTSLEQLLEVLNVQSKEEIRVCYPMLMDNLNSQEDVVLSIDNKIYVDEKYHLTEQFSEDAALVDCETENIDFVNNTEAADNINNWVKEKTNGLIEDIVNKDMFSSLTRAALFNCIYFLGNWVHQFDEKKTQLRDFYISEYETVSLQTMYIEGTFKYFDSDDLNAQFAQLPYKGGKNSLLVCIPKEKTGLESVLDKLNPDKFNDILNSLTDQKLKVFIPRFEFEFNYSDMKESLVKIGLSSIFEPSDDLRGIIDSGENLFVSDIMQKTKIIVNEKGTEAAAATGAIISATAVRVDTTPTLEWNCPGAFFVLSNNNLIFSGVYAGGK